MYGFELNPGNVGGDEGASISIGWSWTKSESYTGNGWRKIDEVFYSGDRTEVDIYLRNGFWSSGCKGTAWFSDFKLEKGDTSTTNWNFLCLIIRSIDATVDFKGNENYHYQASYPQYYTAATEFQLEERCVQNVLTEGNIAVFPSNSEYVVSENSLFDTAFDTTSVRTLAILELYGLANRTEQPIGFQSEQECLDAVFEGLFAEDRCQSEKEADWRVDLSPLIDESILDAVLADLMI